MIFLNQISCSIYSVLKLLFQIFLLLWHYRWLWVLLFMLILWLIIRQSLLWNLSRGSLLELLLLLYWLLDKCFIRVWLWLSKIIIWLCCSRLCKILRLDWLYSWNNLLMYWVAILSHWTCLIYLSILWSIDWLLNLVSYRLLFYKKYYRGRHSVSWRLDNLPKLRGNLSLIGGRNWSSLWRSKYKWTIVHFIYLINQFSWKCTYTLYEVLDRWF